MNKRKQNNLESKGWRFGTVEEFLDLSPEETAYIELKLSLSNKLRKLRREKNFTQLQLAKIINSSQSRVAKLEVGDPSVSIDLLIKSLLALGSSNKEIAKAISSK
ncbi:MAG: helix-turn-helix transcriptional regulator [Ignavibacteriaceae bacterium]|nr:helix-turn-helix transcriptional regulator [Ignavibacteriaceae bacterium]HRI46404.1 helix-turn-helix transcriptional regulator [Ignavibacteriaceae bacterium]